MTATLLLLFFLKITLLDHFFYNKKYSISIFQKKTIILQESKDVYSQQNRRNGHHFR